MAPAPKAEEEEEEAARRRQAQERTPKENLNTCLPECSFKSKTLVKQVRILLTPVSVISEEHNRRRPQKRLLEQFSSAEESLNKEPKFKKACNNSSGLQTRAVMSKASPSHAEVLFNTKSDLHPSVLGAINSDLENDVDPESVKKDDDESTQLSAYEKKRLKNITENANFFASLKLFESAARLRKMTIKGQPCERKKVKPSKAETETTCRRSMRLQRVDPLGIPLPETQAQPELSVEEHPRLPPGPLQMIPADQDQGTELTEGFLNMWAKISQVKPKKIEKTTCNLESYKARLCGMILREDSVAKVVKNRIYSVAIHPSESRTLVAAGDKWGQIGLWDLDCKLEDGIHVFTLHTQPVSCMNFSSFNPAHLLSLSHDGTLRCGDVTRAVFDEVYRNEQYSLSSFDFLADDASTLIVGMWDGEVAVVDQRTPGNSSELSADLNSKTRTVHVHPVSRNYFITAGARDVGIYDVRHLKKSGGRPVVSLTGHTKSVASAYFSPLTGNRVVTTCADDTLRVFGTNCLTSLAPILTTIRHNSNTGRWLTRFRAIWDPKRDDCFVVGSMSRPRQIQAFHAMGELVHSFSSEDHLASVCSVSACHPSRYILAGGNSSGRLHVFKE
ncbi:WD repeat-containing protein 76 [Elgaria multicarinata webbii]|uniref:WD repeat-containing protein 76 n=1 Tax=Elgaria multicarinata webbii TaxID=159646 RepID=UPI002FCCD43E